MIRKGAVPAPPPEGAHLKEKPPTEDEVRAFVEQVRLDYKASPADSCPEGREPYNCIGNVHVAERFRGQLWFSPDAKVDPRDPHPGHYLCVIEIEGKGACRVDIAAPDPIREMPADCKDLPTEEALERMTGYGRWRLNQDFGLILSGIAPWERNERRRQSLILDLVTRFDYRLPVQLSA